MLGLRGFLRRARSDRGANLVEFAIILPFLLLLLLGTIEFAWIFSQNLDVRHGAREGARLIAVNYPDGPNASSFGGDADLQTEFIVDEVCSRMEVSSGGNVVIQSGGGVTDSATATVTAPINTLTGFLDWAIPSGANLSSTVEIRVEQPAGWSNNDPAGRDCPTP